LVRHGRDSGGVEAADASDVDGEGTAQAVPGVDRRLQGSDPAASFDEVDGELFEMRLAQRGGTHYTWLTGLDPDYGFAESPTNDMSLNDHRESIRGFPAMIDPSTGYTAED
jgi:hypothetical protein